MASLGTLTLDLIARIGGFTKPLDQAERKASKTSRKIAAEQAKIAAEQAKITRAINKSIAGMASGLLAVAAPAALVAIGKSALQAADAIGKVATTAGLSTDTIQELRHAASLSGIDFGELDSGLQGFTKRVGELRAGTGSLYTYLQKSDKALLSQVKSAHTADEALGIVYDAMKDVTNQADRAALAAAAFGRSGMRMSIMADNIKDLRQEARDLGLVIDEDLIRNAEKANDKMDTMSRIISTQLTSAFLELAPLIIEVTQGITVATLAISKFFKASEKKTTNESRLNELTEELNALETALKSAVDAGSKEFVTFTSAGAMVNTIGSARAQIKMLKEDIDKLNGDGGGTNGDAESDSEKSKRLKKELKLNKQYYDLVNKWGEESARLHWENKQKELDDEMQFYDDKLYMLKMYAEQEEEINKELAELRSELNKTYWDEYLESMENNMLNMDSIVGDTLDNFSSRLGDFFASAIMDSENLGDAFKNMAEGMARSILSAIGQMIAQWVVMAITKKAILAATTAASVTEAGIVAAAWAPAAAAVSLATFGANAAPAGAGIAGTYALASGLSLTGMAKDGIDKIPEDGTWLLHKGERVVSSQTSKKLDDTLTRIQTDINVGGVATTSNYSKPVRGGDVIVHINGNFIGNNAATRDLAKIIKKEIHREETRIGAVN